MPQGAELGVRGITSHLTSNKDFYRVDNALRVPDVPIEGFTLRIHGMVDQELELSFEDLLSRRLVEERITLTCVSNEVGGEYVGNATWIGVPIARPARGGRRPGRRRRGQVDQRRRLHGRHAAGGAPGRQRDALVAIAMNGEPLPLEHGFPVRMVTPGLYGYVSATKWLVDLEVTRFADFKAYWTTRGYVAEAPIKTSSRIDVPRSLPAAEGGTDAGRRRRLVPGTAASSKVEVRVGRRPTGRRPTLATEDNVDTWRQWVYRWDADAGHLQDRGPRDRQVRLHPDREQRAPIAPDGVDRLAQRRRHGRVTRDQSPALTPARTTHRARGTPTRSSTEGTAPTMRP